MAIPGGSGLRVPEAAPPEPLAERGAALVRGLRVPAVTLFALVILATQVFPQAFRPWSQVSGRAQAGFLLGFLVLLGSAIPLAARLRAFLAQARSERGPGAVKEMLRGKHRGVIREEALLGAMVAAPMGLVLPLAFLLSFLGQR